MRKVCENVSLRPTDLFCSFCWNDSAWSLFSVTITQLFSQNLSYHILCSCLEVLSTTNNHCNFWRSKFQEVSTYVFCSRDDVFPQNWNCSSPKHLCKCTESPSTMSTNSSKEWNIYFSWSNHLQKPFRLEKNVASFSEQQNKTSGTDEHNGCFLPLVSLKSMWILWKNFWALVWIAGCQMSDSSFSVQ